MNQCPFFKLWNLFALFLAGETERKKNILCIHRSEAFLMKLMKGFNINIKMRWYNYLIICLVLCVNVSICIFSKERV